MDRKKSRYLVARNKTIYPCIEDGLFLIHEIFEGGKFKPSSIPILMETSEYFDTRSDAVRELNKRNKDWIRTYSEADGTISVFKVVRKKGDAYISALKLPEPYLLRYPIGQTVKCNIKTLGMFIFTHLPDAIGFMESRVVANSAFYILACQTKPENITIPEKVSTEIGEAAFSFFYDLPVNFRPFGFRDVVCNEMEVVEVIDGRGTWIWDDSTGDKIILTLED